MRFILLLLIALPIVEMLVMFEVADVIGGPATVLLVVLTALTGIQVIRRQGFRTLTRANERLRAGQLPAHEMLEGLCLAVGGVLLLVPGFISDLAGAVFLLPPTRRRLIRKVLKSGRFSIPPDGGAPGSSYTNYSRRRPGPGDKDVYEGEFTRENPPDSRLEDKDRD